MSEKLYKATIKNRIVELDGSEYNECTFLECILRFYGFQPYYMVNCTFNKCRFELAGPAANTVGYMASMYKGGGEGGKALILDVIYNITDGEHGKKLEVSTSPVAEEQSHG